MKPAGAFRSIPLGLVLPLVLGACGTATTPGEGIAPRAYEQAATDVSPAITPDEVTPVATGLRLRVTAPAVRYREQDADELDALPVDETRDVPAGAEIVVAESGRAALSWAELAEGPSRSIDELAAPAAELMTGDLLSYTELGVDSFETEPAHLSLRQTAGVARFTAVARGVPAEVTIDTSLVIVGAHDGPADFIVSFDPCGAANEEPVVWVMVVDGEVALTGYGTGRSQASAVEPGEVAIIATGAEIAAVVEVTVTAIEEWFAAIAGGTSCEPIVGRSAGSGVNATDEAAATAAEVATSAALEPTASGTGESTSTETVQPTPVPEQARDGKGKEKERATQAPTIEPTETPCPCTPPTRAPTRTPRPTKPPVPTDMPTAEPTEKPAPTTAPVPTSPPEPSSEPRPTSPPEPTAEL